MGRRCPHCGNWMELREVEHGALVWRCYHLGGYIELPRESVTVGDVQRFLVGK